MNYWELPAQEQQYNVVTRAVPSSLAVQAAEELGVTVAGFVRDGGFDLYSHPERVNLAS